MNKVVLMGRLTRDPELRLTKTNKALAQFTLAVNRRRNKNGETGADFIQVVAWEKLADFCGKYLKKGQQISIVGKNTSRTWEDGEGKKHYSMEVVANEMFFADAKSNDKSVTHNDTDFQDDLKDTDEIGDNEEDTAEGINAETEDDEEDESEPVLVTARGRKRKD